MAILASVYLEGLITDDLGFPTSINSIPATSSVAVIGHSRLALVSGNNTITIPAGARGVIITLAADANLKTLKGVVGDTGIAISSSGAKTFMLLLGASPGVSFVITSAGLDVGFSEFFFF